MRPRMCGDLIGPGGVSRPGEVRRGQAVSRSGGQPVRRSGGRAVRFSPWGFSVLFGQGV